MKRKIKCRFEHDGDCCNSGATQYMCKCKQPCDTIVPITNADRIRAMTDKELAVFFADEVPRGDCYGCELDCLNCGRGKFEDSCQYAFYLWLTQIFEG